MSGIERNQILAMAETFEGHAQQTENGVEYWLARDLLVYPAWRNFLNIIAKAETACEVSDHFVDVNKMVELDEADRALFGKGTQEMKAQWNVPDTRPEALPPAKDVKKVERRLTSEEKKALKNPDRLEQG